MAADIRRRRWSEQAETASGRSKTMETRADYGNGYTFFGFDLSPDLCSDDGHFNIVRKGNLRLEVHFARRFRRR